VSWDNVTLGEAQARLRKLEEAILRIRWQNSREGKVCDETGLPWRDFAPYLFGNGSGGSVSEDECTVSCPVPLGSGSTGDTR